MRTRPSSILAAVSLRVMALATTACATGSSYLSPTGSNTTLMAGWEHHFSFEWMATEQSQSSRKVSGYVYNRNGEFATSLRVLEQAVDSGGAVVGQRIAYVPGGVGGLGRAYFEVPNLPSTASYRLSVWDYTWFQADGDKR